MILKFVLNQVHPLNLVFQALADPTRRALVDRLSRGPASVSELAEPLRMSLPAVVQHLQVLETSGLIRTEKVGRVRMCRMNGAMFGIAEQWIRKRRAACARPSGRQAQRFAARPGGRTSGVS